MVITLGTIWTSPGYQKAEIIANCVHSHFAHVCFDTEVVKVVIPDPYDDNVDDEGITIEPPDSPEVRQPTPPHDVNENETKQGMMNPFMDDIDYQLAMTQREQATTINPDQFQTDSVNNIINQRELLSWHFRLGHLSMNKVQRLASVGLLPSKIAQCKVPVCQSCMYGMMTRQPWRTKGDLANIAHKLHTQGNTSQ
jgi:GAG-pre-integrase domain